MKERKKATFLKGREFLVAVKALEEKAEEFRLTRPTREEAASILTTMCGFEVTTSNVSYLKEVTGLEWKSINRGATSVKLSERVTALKTLVHDLAGTLRDICIRLGEQETAKRVKAVLESYAK